MTRTYTRRICKRPSGFTLIELMVTLVIISLLVGLATLSVGGSAHRHARDEAERLYGLLGYASEAATLEDVEYGLAMDKTGYRFLRFDDKSETWAELTERHFASHGYPESVRARLEVEKEYKLDGASSDSTSPSPAILVLSSGEITPFRLDFESDDSKEPAASITSDGSGTLVWE